MRWCTPGTLVLLTGEGKKTKMSGSSLALQQVQRSTHAQKPTDSEILWSRDKAGDPKFEDNTSQGQVSVG